MLDYSKTFNEIYEMIFNDSILSFNRTITDSMLRSAIEYKITEIDKVVNLTDEVIKDIYYQMIWKSSGCELLPYPINIIQFDNAMDVTPTTSIKGLQKVINELSGYRVVKPTGYVDYNTQKYIIRYTSSKKDIIDFSILYIDLRRSYYKTSAQKRNKYKLELPERYNRLDKLEEIVNQYEKDK